MKHTPILFYLLAAALCLPAGSLHGQAELRLVGGKRVIKLQAGSYVCLQMPVTGVELKSGKRQVAGKLQQVSGDLVSIMPENEGQWLTYTNGAKKEEQVDFKQLNNRQPMNFQINQIESMCYRSTSAEDIRGFGGILFTLGVFSTLVVAPLVSLNYSGKGFNGQRYEQVAGYSLAATGLGTAILLSTPKRRFRLKSAAASEKRERIWALQAK
jgi:hypothetical protein